MRRKVKSFFVERFGVKSMLIWFAIPGLLLSLGNCSDDDGGPKVPPPSAGEEIGKADVWLTTGDQTKLLSHESDLSITETVNTTLPVIAIDASQAMQEIEGFGAALTGSSAYLIGNLGAGQRAALLNELFDAEDGIGISYLRMTIGASDFSLSDYTYNDMPAGETDFDLTKFSIAPDQEDVVPVLKQIVAVAPDIRIMGTPWSAPAWMKTNGSLRYVAGQENKLKTEAYDVYARYFVKYIETFAAEGITIDAITPQNEPLYFTAGYPSMHMTAGEQRDFIKNNLGPVFEAEGIDTKIIIYDHNWDRPEYATSILDDAAAKAYVAGSAFHAYAGNVTAMTTVHNAHPDRGLYFTEISGGEWATNFSDNLQWNMRNIFIGTTKNWSKTALLWNLALDENHGPTNNGCADCRGVVTINAGGSITRNVEYYSIAHFSKFVRPGARRVASSISQSVAGLDYVAFVNSDGSRTLVLANDDTAAKAMTVKEGAAQFNYALPARSVATITWKL